MLIDADEAVNIINKYDDRGLTLDEIIRVTDGIAKEIEAMPTVDAVEVVRCKNCKNYYCEDDSMPYCTRDTIYRDENDYCSIPCRKDGE